MAFQLSTEYEALKHDVNALFSRFYQRQSVRFEDFCTEWKAMNFSCIFAATYRNTSAAKMRIIERVFRVASEFLSEDSSFLYRVGTVYLFYAVYFKQISEHKVKIRMTPTMWKDLTDFLTIVIEHRHLDVAYVIQSLKKHKAFVFTAFPKQLLFGRHEFMLGIEGMSGLRHTYEADRYINDLLQGNEVTELLTSIQKEYEEVKEKVLQESTEDEKPYLSKVLFYSNSEFPDEFQKMIESHNSKHRAGTSLKPDSFNSSQRPVLSHLQDLSSGFDSSNNAPKSPTRGQTIAKIKEKSWKASVGQSPNKHKRGNNNLEIQDDEDIDEGTILYYKKSAMLTPFMVKPAKRTLSSKGTRYKAPTED